ncbi:hypothetical protein ABZX39_21865 [Streptomyces collinus]|uniref:hypothetical protein n=1 Tax=Streptomyces collinus TaxID=42684 RepID=UPI0033B1C4F6
MHITHVRHDYAFTCLHCGHGWGDAYDIDMITDGEAWPIGIYHREGTPVISPLRSPSCPACKSHAVRIIVRVKEPAPACSPRG